MKFTHSGVVFQFHIIACKSTFFYFLRNKSITADRRDCLGQNEKECNCICSYSVVLESNEASNEAFRSMSEFYYW